MAEYDLVIRGGTIVEGTGVPRYKADVAIKNGRIAMISGRIKAGGAKEIDASGSIVAPGFVDLHTHYDAQLYWDPYCSLSGWFGVTSLTIGMCGFGFAPTKPQDRDRAMLLMNRVEAIPLESMRTGMSWDWVSFPEYLDSVGRQELGVNVASLFPFNPLRGYVLGMQAAREKTSVTEAELAQMKQLFHEGMKAGAFGFSGNMSQEDRNEEGGPLPSHIASKEEWLGLAEVLGEFGIGIMGWSTHQEHPEWSRELITEMMRVSGRPLHMTAAFEVVYDSVWGGAGGDSSSASWMASARAEGLPLLIQQAPFSTDTVRGEFTLAEYNLYDYMDDWVQPLVGTAEERMVKLRDPEVRAAMQRELDKRPNNMRSHPDIVRVEETVHERNRKYEGMTIGEVARMQNKTPLDAWLDLAIDEGMQTLFSTTAAGRTEEELQRYIMDPYTHISISDGGAHVKYHTISTWPIYFLYHWVRDNGIMSLEEAAYKMSAYPAWLAGLRDRGMLRIGSWADIAVYDLDKLGFMYDKHTYAHDFPGGERRVIQKPTGLRYTLVNGTVTFEDNECTGALPGKLLRSYDMRD